MGKEGSFRTSSSTPRRPGSANERKRRLTLSRNLEGDANPTANDRFRQARFLPARTQRHRAHPRIYSRTFQPTLAPSQKRLLMSVVSRATSITISSCYHPPFPFI